MVDVKLFNKISNTGLKHFTQDYNCSEDSENYDAILVRSAKLHEVVFPKSLLCIARAGAGVNNVPIDKASELGIAVFNTPGANANAVKELVIAALLLASRDIAQGIAWMKQLEGDDISPLVEKGKSSFVGPEIAGKKLGVIGLGAIGVQVANVATALGMEVYGYDPFISIDAAWSLKRSIHHSSDVNEIYENCDYITLHLPLNDETKNMINAAAFKKMKKGMRILNFARGGLVDEDALIHALDDDICARYVSDFASGKILNHEHVIAIPHLGASTPESEDNCAVMAVQEIREYIETGNITNSVNLPNMDMAMSAKHRICIINKNIPNMVGFISTILAQHNINIDNMANRSRNDYAYTIVETNDEINPTILQSLQDKEGIIKVRLIH
ncbi:MAG: phosphoglycerate dehydrogenase [Erysipelotrichaceae bacterium]